CAHELPPVGFSGKLLLLSGDKTGRRRTPAVSRRMERCVEHLSSHPLWSGRCTESAAECTRDVGVTPPFYGSRSFLALPRSTKRRARMSFGGRQWGNCTYDDQGRRSSAAWSARPRSRWRFGSSPAMHTQLPSSPGRGASSI